MIASIWENDAFPSGIFNAVPPQIIRSDKANKADDPYDQANCIYRARSNGITIFVSGYLTTVTHT